MACFDYQRGIHASLRADRILALERAEGHLPLPPLITLGEWLQRPVADEPRLRLRATISATGMKALDWSAFGPSLIQDAAGRGYVDTDIPAGSVEFHARHFLQLGSEATIESPPELIAMLREQAAAILALYS